MPAIYLDTYFHPRNTMEMSELTFWRLRRDCDVKYDVRYHKIAQNFIQFMFQCQKMIWLSLKFIWVHIFIWGTRWWCQNSNIFDFLKAKTWLWRQITKWQKISFELCCNANKWCDETENMMVAYFHPSCLTTQWRFSPPKIRNIIILTPPDFWRLGDFWTILGRFGGPWRHKRGQDFKILNFWHCYRFSTP